MPRAYYQAIVRHEHAGQVVLSHQVIECKSRDWPRIKRGLDDPGSWSTMTSDNGRIVAIGPPSGPLVDAYLARPMRYEMMWRFNTRNYHPN
jgi:hypothetical protein